MDCRVEVEKWDFMQVVYVVNANTETIPDTFYIPGG